MATFDPNIVLQAKPLTDPMESYGRALTLKTIGQQQKMQEAQMAKYEEDRAAESALNELYRSSVDPTGKVDRNALLSGAASRGLGSRIPTLQKGFAEHDKAIADVKKTSVETQAAGAKLISEGMARLASNPNVTHQDVIAWAASLPSDVIDPNQTAQIIRTLPPGPALRQTLMMYGANADARLKALTPELQAINLGGTTQMVDKNAFTNPQAVGQVLQQTQSPESRAANAVAIRGQNMADARARESTAAAMTKPFEVTGPDGLPVLVQQDRQGNITPVQGFGPKSGASKPLNDSQAKALLFGSRMQEADKLLTGLSGKGVDTPSLTKQAVEGLPLVGGALGAAANTFVASDDQQSVEQAQRDFVNAVLRRESGAAISPTEFESAKKQYFPAVGDSDQVKAQKAQNRQLAIKGLLAEVPEGQRKSLSTPAAPSGPKPGTVEGGYVFMGGDPADQKNWKKK